VQRAGVNLTIPDSGTEARLHVILERSALFFAGATTASCTHSIGGRSKSLGVIKEPFYGVVFVNRIETAGRHTHDSHLGDAIPLTGLNYASLNDTSKVILSLAMLLGRLEIYTVLVLLMPEFWNA
jgi:hypothetical protein